jgi:hypothetical protein
MTKERTMDVMATDGTRDVTRPVQVRTRRSKKRLVFQPPRQMPRSVRSLWESASPEERAGAHARCVAVLSMWLGHQSRAQVARELELPPLRVWQLSQAALAGMLAGLLKQPRGRGREPGEPPSGEEDVRLLRKRVSELEQENRTLRDLVEILRNLPAAREQPKRPRTARKTKTSPKTAARRTSGGGKAVLGGDEGAGGTAAGEPDGPRPG